MLGAHVNSISRRRLVPICRRLAWPPRLPAAERKVGHSGDKGQGQEAHSQGAQGHVPPLGQPRQGPPALPLLLLLLLLLLLAAPC